ncbi:MAG TPA: arylsulfatase, partial [Firmicutes bacterium]|nr:arylsulfatase [Bacillota bacterium]
MKTILNKYLKNYVTYSIIASLVLNFLIEVMSRHSLIEAVSYLSESPLVFLYNSSLILFTFSILLFIRRKIFVFATISTLWFAGGLTNGIILANRVTPFTATELKQISSTFDILEKYFSKFELTMLFAGVGVVILAIIAAFFFAPRDPNKIKWKRSIATFVIGVAAFFGVTKAAIETEVISTYFGNIAFAYLDYGFPYCFTNTVINTGIKRPTTYNEENMNSIISQLNGTSTSDPLTDLNQFVDVDNSVVNPETRQPNIIMIQLESFFDPTYMEALTFSEDPIPNFRQLKEDYSSGFVRVPSIGAGTANTEFEVISGMNLEYFGPGEYPYKTILRKVPAESVSYNLRDLGYTTHAIHNNKGTFYTRQGVFKNLGFDTFTSIEYMNIEEYTPLGWAKDKYLTQSILDSLNSTETADFIYTISVQGHGDYPTYPVEGHSTITVEGFDDQERLNSFEYYVNEIKQMDEWIGDLINTLSQVNEDVVLVLFGDHLPTLGITDEEILNGDTFQTEYVVWDNMHLPKENKDLEAYQLSAHVLNMLNIHHGTLMTYHQNFENDEDYYKNLEMLQYDMLYGNQYVYDGQSPYEKLKMRMGVKDIVIEDIIQEGDDLVIKGQNFTDSSRIRIGDNTYTTTYVDAETL